MPSEKIKHSVIECRLDLVQRKIYHNGLSNYNFMLDIATFLACSIKEVRTNSEHPQYRVRTKNLASNIILESYLTKETPFLW